MTKSKKIILIAALSSAGLHLLIFLMYFISYCAVETDVGSDGLQIYAYVRGFATRFLEFSIPAAACVCVYLADSSQRLGRAAVKCLLISLGRLIYLLPYYYLVFMEIFAGLDSGEAFLMSCLSSLLGLILFSAYTLLLYASVRFVAERLEYRRALRAMTPQAKEGMTKKDLKNLRQSTAAAVDACPRVGSAFDFGYAVCAGLFAPAFIQFIVYFAQELIATVDYLSSYAGYYRAGEIVYMIISFLFIFASMIATHLISHKLAVALGKADAPAD